MLEDILEANRQILEVELEREIFTHSQTLFTQTAKSRQEQWIENLVKTTLLILTLLIIFPLILIVGFLFYKSVPRLAFEF